MWDQCETLWEQSKTMWDNCSCLLFLPLHVFLILVTHVTTKRQPITTDAQLDQLTQCPVNIARAIEYGVRKGTQEVREVPRITALMRLIITYTRYIICALYENSYQHLKTGTLISNRQEFPGWIMLTKTKMCLNLMFVEMFIMSATIHWLNNW